MNWPSGEEVRFTGELHPLVAELPWYRTGDGPDCVPKDPLEHLGWRVELADRAAQGWELQQDLLQACAEDLLFFINAFCWIYEPREGVTDSDGNPVYGTIPFCTWEHQDPVIAALQKYFGTRHIVERKSREQGASWKVLATYLWAWRFRKGGCVLGMGSETAEKADSAKHGSLGWKFDFLLKNLPAWMLPKGWNPDRHRSKSESTWTNPETGALLYAESATENIGRSDRYTSFFLDEAGFFLPGHDKKAIANLTATTNQILLISSSNSENTEHYRILQNPGPWLTVTLDWRDNPVHRRGKYTSHRGKLIKLDEDYEFPENYPFILDGRVRSVWYDNKWHSTGGNAKDMAREYDMDFGGASGKPFNPESIERYKARCCDPIARGDIHVPDLANLKVSEWSEEDRGAISLWVPLTSGRPPRMRLAVGCDLCTGTGGSTTSNSVAIFMDVNQRRQVAEVARNDMDGDVFAEYIYAVCAWFGWDGSMPLLSWERNGSPGSKFSQRIKDLAYPNCWVQPAHDEFRPFSKPGLIGGYHNNNKAETLRPLMVAMNKDEFEFYSRSLIIECSEYIYVEGVGSKIEHPKSRTGFDASEQGENHGDRAVAAAICIRAMQGVSRFVRPEATAWEQLHKSPPGSLGERIYKAQSEAADPLSCEW